MPRVAVRSLPGVGDPCCGPGRRTLGLSAQRKLDREAWIPTHGHADAGHGVRVVAARVVAGWRLLAIDGFEVGVAEPGAVVVQVDEIEHVVQARSTQHTGPDPSPAGWPSCQ